MAKDYICKFSPGYKSPGLNLQI